VDNNQAAQMCVPKFYEIDNSRGLTICVWFMRIKNAIMLYKT